MAVTIDELNIKISANADKAVQSLDRLSNAFSTLSTALKGLETTSFASISNSLAGISNAMIGLKNAGVGKTDFNKLAKGLSSLSSINTSNLSNLGTALTTFSTSLGNFTDVSVASKSIRDLAFSISTLGGVKATQAVSNLAPLQSSLNGLITSLNSLGKINFDLAGLATLTSSISKLGGRSIVNATNNMPKLTLELRNLITTLSKAPAVSNNVVSLIQALSNLSSAGIRTAEASTRVNKSLSNFNLLSSRTSKSAFSLAAAFGKMYANYFIFIRAFKALWSSIRSSMNYIEVLNYFDKAFQQVASNAEETFKEAGYNSAEEYAQAFAERAGQLTEKLTGFNMDRSGVLNATGGVSLGLNPSQVLQTQATFAQLSSSMGISARNAEILSRVFTELGADLASVRDMSFDTVWNSLQSGMVGMARTVDRFGANIRNVNLQQKLLDLGIETNITNLNQQYKTLLRTIIILDSTRYAWADLSTTLNTPSNQLRILQSQWKMLGQTIGNLFIPIVAKALPYINALVIALQRLFTWFAQILGIDLSKITNSISNVDLSEFLDSAEESEEALAGVNKGIDKLKKGIRGFDELNVITTKDDTSTASAGGLGVPDMGVLDDAFLSITDEYQRAWDKAFASLENKAQSLADKLEKYFNPIKSIFYDIVNGHWELAGLDLSRWIVDINEGLTDLLASVDWEKIGNNIGEFLAGMDWKSITNSLGELFWEGLSDAIDFWKGSFDKAPIETGLITAFALLNFTGLGKLFWAKLGELFAPIIAKIAPILGGIGLIIAGITLALIGFIDMLKNGFSWIGEIALVVGTALATVGAIILGAPALVAGVVAAIALAVFNLIILIKQYWTEITQTLKAILMAVVTAITGFIVSGLSNIATFLVNFIKEAINLAKSLFKGIWQVLTDVYELVGSILEAIIRFVIAVFTGKWKVAWEGVVKVFKKVFETVVDVAKVPLNILIGIINTLQKAIESTINFFIDAINLISFQVPDWVPGIGGKSISPNIPRVNFGDGIEYFANGGFVKSATIFGAGENGKVEMLGNIGGKTAVASNAEITGIADAVYSTSSTEAELMREQNALLRQLLNKEFGITKNELFNSVRSSANEYTMRTGKFAF